MRAYTLMHSEFNQVWFVACVFQHLDRCVPVARLKITAFFPWPLTAHQVKEKIEMPIRYAHRNYWVAARTKQN